nr:hypothetical protein [uncultured Desulfobacter sp.]
MEINFSNIAFGLFAVEQVIMTKLGTYPYLLGFPLTNWIFPSNVQSGNFGGWKLIGRIKVKRDSQGNIFIRHRHFPLTWGPYVLVGHVKKENPNSLIIRIGPLTAFFFGSFIIQGLLGGLYSIFITVGTVSAFILYFGASLVNGWEAINEKHK